MKKIYFTLMFITVLNIGFAQYLKQDYPITNLKGKVKSVKEAPFIAIEKFGNIEKGKRERGEFPTWEQDYGFITTYDNKGNIIEKKCFNSDGSIMKKLTFDYNDKGNIIKLNIYKNENDEYTETYKYDENTNQIEKKCYKSDGSFMRKISIKYDDKGNKIEEVYEAKGDTSNDIYKYDDKGNNIESGFLSNGTFILEFAYTYDEIGKIKEKKCYNNDGILFIVENYKYDINSMIIEKIVVENDEKAITTYKYDFYGNLIEENSCCTDGKNDNQFFKYEYDNKGNWISKTIFHNQIPTFIIEREIKYYE